MHFFTHFIPILATFLIIANPLSAQKPAVKSVQQQKYVLSANKEIKLSFQIDQSYNRYGNMIKQEYLYPRPNSSQLQTDRKILHSYDARSRHLGTMEYNGDNLLEAETKIYWDDKDNKTKVEEIRYSNGEQTANVTTYSLQYDANGNKKSEIHYTPDGIQEKVRLWFYNENDELVKTTLLTEKKNQPVKRNIIIYKRDEKGNLTKSISKEYVNKKEYRKDIQYFSNNHVIRWRKYINKRFDSEFINEYRDSVVIRTTSRNTKKMISLEQAQKEQEKAARRANKKRNKNKTKSAEIWVTNTEYDAYGNVAISSQSVNNQVKTVTQYEYDDYGNCIHTTKVNKETGEKEEETTEYETYGNISRRSAYLNGQLISEEKFLYEYYPRE